MHSRSAEQPAIANPPFPSCNISHYTFGLGLMATKQQPTLVQIPVPTTEDIQQVDCRCSLACSLPVRCLVLTVCTPCAVPGGQRQADTGYIGKLERWQAD